MMLLNCCGKADIDSGEESKRSKHVDLRHLRNCTPTVAVSFSTQWRRQLWGTGARAPSIHAIFPFYFWDAENLTADSKMWLEKVFGYWLA